MVRPSGAPRSHVLALNSSKRQAIHVMRRQSRDEARLRESERTVGSCHSLRAVSPCTRLMTVHGCRRCTTATCSGCWGRHNIHKHAVLRMKKTQGTRYLQSCTSRSGVELITVYGRSATVVVRGTGQVLQLWLVRRRDKDQTGILLSNKGRMES